MPKRATQVILNEKEQEELVVHPAMSVQM